MKVLSYHISPVGSNCQTINDFILLLTSDVCKLCRQTSVIVYSRNSPLGGNQEVGGWPGECLQSYSCPNSQQCEIVAKLASHLR